MMFPVHQISHSPIYGRVKGSSNSMLGSLFSSGLHRLEDSHVTSHPSGTRVLVWLQEENEEEAVCKPRPGGPLWTVLWVSQS